MSNQRAKTFLFIAVLGFVAAPLAGCLAPFDTAQAASVKEIRFWVEEIEWEVHPGVTTPVWAFCAEGDGVEPAHGDEPCGVPGPTIRVTKGDTVRITFENTHSIPHTVHFHGWHGMPADMNGNLHVGGHMVADPGETEVFEWTAEPLGTFIYHCHFETPLHMEMGMYGAFIVEDPLEGEKPDKEYVAVLDEWQIRDEPEYRGNMPAYNYFTINGKSFPLTQPWFADKGDKVRIHMVNAGYEFHAFHVHGYTPDSWEGVAGPKHRVPTDVRAIAPGQSVVLEFDAAREGVWLAHDHVVPRVTAASDGNGFGAYPRGMLAVLAVGKDAQDALVALAPSLVEDAKKDVGDPDRAHDGHDHGGGAAGTTVDMKSVQYATPELTVKVGEKVTWVNKDPMMHTVTSTNGAFDSGEIQAGASWSHAFTEPGTYQYYCKPHAAKDKSGEWKGMVATVVVEAA